MLCSYAAKLAESKSRRVREIVESDEFGQLFPGITTRQDSRAVELWSLNKPYEGGMIAAGVGGPITGHGALLGIIDDPFENWAQAQSQTIRDKVWDWYRSTFLTRLWEHNRLIIIMTRWHEDDLVGRLLKEEGSEWVVLRLPALSENQTERDFKAKRQGLPEGLPDPLHRAPDEALAPRLFSRGELKRKRKSMGSMAWEAEYQGYPVAEEGNMFKRQWFSNVVRSVPANVVRVRYWDKAGTEDGGKFTAGVLMAYDSEGRFYVEDVVRGQWSAAKREYVILETSIADTVRAHGQPYFIWVEQEPASGGKESADNTAKMLRQFAIHLDKVTGSKDVRMQPFAAAAERGAIYLVYGTWNGAFVDEICAIPNGMYRDQADGAGGAYVKLAAGFAETAYSSATVALVENLFDAQEIHGELVWDWPQRNP